MKRNCTLFFVLFAFVFNACSPDTLTVQVIRHPTITFSLNGSLWKSDQYSISAPSMVVVYPSDTTQAGALYNRYIFQATGKDDQNKNLQLIISIDASQANQLVGTYVPLHSLQRGLGQVQLYDLTNSNDLMAYQLCNEVVPGSVFQVQKQSEAERLITGNFQFTLCNVRDTTQKITITNGTFTDIKY